MKRYVAALLVVLGLVGVVGVLAIETGYAKEDENEDENAEARCSEATLDGRYLHAFDGHITKGKDQGPFAVAGYQVFDGNGKSKGVSSFSVNGKITENEPFSSTYKVKADCTGTQVVEAAITTEYDLFIAPDGSMYTFVQTDPGTVASGFVLRATATRVAQ
jgi:hypothetical protein